MASKTKSYLEFLQDIYGQSVIDEIIKASGMRRSDVEAASDAFAPVFLQNLFGVSKDAPTKPAAFGANWSKDLLDAMQGFLEQGAKMAQSIKPASDYNGAGFPFSLIAEQTAQMERLNQVFLGQVAQAQLMEEVGRKTGISSDQLKHLFPMLTTYGLLPLMPFSQSLSTPALDDPAGWIDYLGTLTRQQFKKANQDFEALPNPLNAAFDGFLSGFFPKAPAPAPTPKETEGMKSLQDAGLEFQATYLKSLGSLFESYQSGLSSGYGSTSK